jgi:hypothetical protein
MTHPSSRAFALLTALPLLVLAARARAADRAAECADQAEQAQVLRDGRRLVEARALMVSCAQRECPTVVRASCTEWLTEVDKRVPSIVVSVKDEDGRDVANVHVSVDGARASDDIATSAVRLDPGEHTLRYEHAGYRSVDERVVLREGEGLRVLRVTLARDGATAPVRTTLPSTPPAPAGPRSLSPFVYVLGGAAVVAAGVFTYFGLSGASQYRHLEGTCAPHCSSSDMDGVRGRFLVADVALVTGLLALGGAAGFFFFGSPRSEPGR